MDSANTADIDIIHSCKYTAYSTLNNSGAGSQPLFKLAIVPCCNVRASLFLKQNCYLGTSYTKLIWFFLLEISLKLVWKT